MTEKCSQNQVQNGSFKTLKHNWSAIEEFITLNKIDHIMWKVKKIMCRKMELEVLCYGLLSKNIAFQIVCRLAVGPWGCKPYHGLQRWVPWERSIVPCLLFHAKVRVYFNFKSINFQSIHFQRVKLTPKKQATSDTLFWHSFSFSFTRCNQLGSDCSTAN